MENKSPSTYAQKRHIFYCINKCPGCKGTDIWHIEKFTKEGIKYYIQCYNSKSKQISAVKGCGYFVEIKSFSI